MAKTAAKPSIYDQNLDKNPANYVPLSPLGFLERCANVYPDYISLINGDVKFTWKQTYARARQLAHALIKRGIGLGDTVAYMAANTPAFYEGHFGVPMAGAVITGLNTRLDPPAIAYILTHSEAKMVIVDRQFAGVMKEALALVKQPISVIGLDDPHFKEGEVIGEKEYEELLKEGDPDYAWEPPADEWQALALNYTSGTTGDPKGVVYHHRGAYLNALGNATAWNMVHHPIYLWTLPMFHASGWCFPWTVTAMAGTNICLRKIDVKEIFRLINKHKVTHFTAAPIVLNMILNAPEADKQLDEKRTIEVMTAGSAPAPKILEGMAQHGFNVMHVYGATEVFGPNSFCAWHAEWDALPLEEQAKFKARQGVPYQALQYMTVADPATHQPVPRDGKTIGEIMMRGSAIMKGYLKDKEATDKIFREGWYHTGDLGVMHPDGYIEVKDRLKDIIISGAENISSLEVEKVIYRHPAVLEAIIVAMPHPKWEETPCAFVELKPGQQLTEEELIAFCRENLAKFKCPTKVVFGPLEKTPTGKIQKFKYREKAREMAAKGG